MKKQTLQIFAVLILFLNTFPTPLKAQGELWGLTQYGGASGTGVIYKAEADGTGATVMHQFTSAYPGSTPSQTELTVAANGKYYGVVPYGGMYNMGVLFEFDPATGTYTKKIDFISETLGANPEAALTLAGNNKLYGVAAYGGQYGWGTIFEYDPATNTILTRYHFPYYGSAGNTPIGKLMLASNGKLYGNTFRGDGNINDNGVLYEFDPATGAYTAKYRGLFHGWGRLLEASNGLFYGIINYQSSQPSARIFEFNPATKALTIKKDLDGYYSEGMIEVSGKLYGVCDDNSLLTGPGNGFIFEYTPSTNTYVHKFDFTSSNTVSGAFPTGMLKLAGNGKLYGVTRDGGLNNHGVLFEFDLSTSTYQKKFDFAPSNGRFPTGTLAIASDGKMYGLTREGGINNRGILYHFDLSTSSITKRVDFSYSPDGSNPVGSLAQANDRKIYGTTTEGGLNGQGTFFEFDVSTNAYTKLVDLSASTTGASPRGGILVASNGKLYGMTTQGGTNGGGTIFEYNPASNVFSKVFDFSQAAGTQPLGSLIQATNGKLYGLTSSGGTYNSGVLFEFNPTGNVYTKKLEFRSTTTSGVIPYGSLIQADNGKLYGATRSGGPSGSGMLFEFDPITNTYVALPGSCISGGTLVQASNQKLYGRNTQDGNIFEYDLASGTCTIKYTPSAGGGNNVNEADYSLVESTNGKLYGTLRDDAYTVGDVFEFNIASNTFASKSSFHSTNGNGPMGTLLLRITPSVAASAITLASIYSTQLQINFTKGNGAKRLVVIKPNGPVDFSPVENVAYAVGDVGNGNKVVMNDNASGVYTTGLLPNTLYHIKVFEYNELGKKRNYLTTGAPTASFTTLPLPDVGITVPANNAINQNVTVNASAKALSGATTYTLELNTQPDFTGTSIVKSGARTQSFSGLAYSTQYYTRVKTNLSPDYGIVTSFSTATPEFFSYVKTPANAAVNINANLTVTSNTVIGATTYTIELNTASDFSGTSLVKSGTVSQVFNNLSLGTTYYTRVKTDLSPNWGNTRSFTTGDAATLSYITTPANNATNQLWSLNLTCNTVTGASSYTVQLSPSGDFSSGIIENTSSNTIVPFSSLAYNTLYYARVKTDLNPATWGPIRSFTTGYPANFTYLASPSNNSVNVARVVNLVATVVKDATSYTIEVNTAADFTGTSIVNSATSNTISFSLDYATLYYVRVKTNLVPEWGPYRSFTTTTAIANTYITSPANNAVNQLPTLNISANEIYEATSYTIQLSTVSDFSSGIIGLTGPTRTISFPQLAYNTTYYSRVTTNLTPGLWGATRSFKTIDHYITAPTDGATNVNWVTNITSNTISGTSTYTTEVNTAPDFTGTSIVKSGASATQSFTLAYDQLYYVRAKSNLASGWGSVRSFITGNPVSLAYVVAPANGATNVATTVNVSAYTLTGANSYTIELNTASDFTGTSIVKTGAYRLAFTGLTPGTVYYSRVQTSLAPGQWGETRSFTTASATGRIAGNDETIAETMSPEGGFNVILYENPFRHKLSFIISGAADNHTEFRLIDMKGTVIQKGLAPVNQQVDIEHRFTSGIYLLQVTSAGYTRTVRAAKID